MTFSLYDAVVPTDIQILSALEALLDKAERFCGENAITESELIDKRLAPDMLPFGYQVKSCVVHSIGGLDGARAGTFSPDTSAWPTDFAGLHSLLRSAVSRLRDIGREEIDGLAEANAQFISGEMRMSFTGAEFLLSFSQPNFYFHAATAYAILRAHGVDLSKRDFMGMPRMKQQLAP